MEDNVKKPLRKGNGWHVKSEFIDATGEVYSKGKITDKRVDQTEEDLQWLTDNGYDKDGVPTGEVAYNKKNPSEKIDYQPKDQIHIPTSSKEREKELESKLEELTKIVTNYLAQPQQQEGVIINAKEKERFGTLNTKNIPAGDYEAEESTFIHRGWGTLISFRIEDGMHIYAPYNMPMVFKYERTEVHRSGRTTDHNYYATFKTNSKLEKEFLRKHEKYNITIFEKVDAAIKFDMETSIKMGNLSSWVNSLKPDQIYGEAARRQIPITDKSMEELKMAIMFARFDELSKEDGRKNEQRVANMNELFKK
jgi:hypothetical protein